MLLRSSSTPNPHHTLFSESPTGDFIATPTAASHHRKIHNLDHLSTTHSHHRRCLLQLRSFSSESSPSKPRFRTRGFNSLQRSQSEGNLEGLALTSQEFKAKIESLGSMLHTEPSFCIYADEDGVLENENGNLGVESVGSGADFSFSKSGMGLIVEDDENVGIGEKERREDEKIEPLIPKMYLATGFGVDNNAMGNRNGVELKRMSFDEGGDVEECYKRMVSEDPSNPLFLRNYAQLLQSKGDLKGAEDYYFRATLEDPKDGEILMQYAKLVWELHHDKDMALSYFERAACAAPEDCNVLAAYASFLWDIDEAENNDQITELVHLIQKTVEGNGACLDNNIDYAAQGSGMDGNLEEHYKKMIDENPCNPLVLRNYAHFLEQSKGDLQGAEEYYSRAILADPGDSEVISQYAQLVWELHHDQDKASSYFERAVHAAPADSHVLAAYAKFLWEAEDEEDCGHPKDEIQPPILQGAVAPA